MFGSATFLHVLKMLCAQNSSSNDQKPQNELETSEIRFKDIFALLASPKSAKIDHLLEPFSSMNTTWKKVKKAVW